MAKRTFNVVGLGEKHGIKAVDLALSRPATGSKRPQHNFIAVDLQSNLQYGRVLKVRRQREKPANLSIMQGTDAVKFLSEQKPASIDHLYAHFLLQHMGHAARQELFAQMMRTLRPGARFVTVEEAYLHRVLPGELRNAGFRVFVKRATPREVLKLGTQHARENAMAVIMARAQRNLLDPATEKSLVKKGLGDIKAYLRGKFTQLDSPKPSPEAKQALKLLLKDTELLPRDIHFISITATKSRVKYVGPEGAHTTRRKLK